MSADLELFDNGNNRSYSSPLAFPVKVKSAPVPLRPAYTKTTPDWLQALAILQKHRRSSLLFAGIVLFTVILGTFLMKPVYEPAGRLEIDPPGPELVTVANTVNESGSQEYLDTEAKNLESDELAVSVIRALHLDGNPEFVSGGKGGQSQAADQTNNAAPALTPAENAALRVFHTRLKVNRDPTSRIITVSFAAHNPQLAATVVNTTLQMFIDRTYQDRHNSIVKTSDFLSAQLEDIRKKVDDSNSALTAFQEKTGISDIDDTKSTFSEKMADLSKQQTEAEGERVQLGSVLGGVQGDHPDALTEVHSNPIVQDLEKQLAETRAELRKTEVVYGENHPNVKKLQSQADELQAQLNQQRSSILRMLRANYSAARVRERTLANEIRSAGDQLNQMAQYSALKKEVQTNSTLYNDLYKQVKEAAIAAGAKLSDMQIVDRARVLDRPTRPNIALNLGVGLLAAIIGGIFIAFIREMFDQRLRTAQDVESLIGDAAVLVPSFKAPLAAPERKVFYELQAAEIPQKFLQSRPHSPESEALQGLITSILLSRREAQNQVLLVASSFAREGKTTLAVNLALSLAQYGPTCIIDADLRRPRVAKVFRVSDRPGLSELLTNQASLDEALHLAPDTENVQIIPAGAETKSAASMVGSEAMRELVQELRQQFHSVIIDSPPILPYADGRALSTLADGVIFICRSGVTTREAFLRSQEVLRKLRGAPILEVVLNAAPFQSGKEWQYQYDYK